MHEICAKCDFVHGTLLHHGDPSLIGVDINKPINSNSVMVLLEDEEYVFSACGVTTDKVFQECKEIDLVICVGLEQTLVSDVKAKELYYKNQY